MTQDAATGKPPPRLARTPALVRPTRPALILGGAGFIGCNLADALLRDGHDVIVFDNLGRPGVERNLAWLQATHRGRLQAVRADIRDQPSLHEAVARAGVIFHLAAQVAVTTSLADPLLDFATNAGGTLSVLEAVRTCRPDAPLIFASTNKVYGPLGDLSVVRVDDRLLPGDETIRRHGIDERTKLDFCTPYGCSKGAADQYVLDYAHSYGLRTAVLRMSCIYGPRQFGTEDQGWVAHFLISAMRGEPITLYGDGRQVRDILHVADAVAAYRAVAGDINRLRGRAFNLGGGPANAVDLRTVLNAIADITGAAVPVQQAGTRSGDQPYFVADTRLLTQETGWQARIGWQVGLQDLAAWVGRELLPEPASARRQAALRVSA